MSLTLQRLAENLSAFPAAKRRWIAFSGGLDSMVLLHALAELDPGRAGTLCAVHINHGLQPDAARWAEHCAEVCAALAIPFNSVVLQVAPARGESLEAAAREARYSALRALMGRGDLLLTAHHRDDQAETVLLQLLRGSGPSGLAAMPALAPFAPGWIARPLLDFSRADLEHYALDHRLTWVEDGSNRDTRFDRNFLRGRVMPLLRERWPALDRTLSRSARHCAEAQALIESHAERDLSPLLDESGRLALSGLLALSPPEARAVLRLWIKRSGLPTPDTTHLDRILREMAVAAEDRSPRVHWPGAEVRRYRDRLYLGAPLVALDPHWQSEWDGRTPLPLPAELGMLRVERGAGGIPAARWEQGIRRVRLRRPGDRCRFAAGKSSDLTKLFQERAIPPWLRARLPVVELDGEVVAVADLWVCAVPAASDGIRLRWVRQIGQDVVAD